MDSADDESGPTRRTERLSNIRALVNLRDDRTGDESRVVG
jgi:hypothetical protein